jgi:Uncharacterized protein conserved in bacteria
VSQRTFLLDTNILLAAVLAPDCLPQAVQNDLIDASNTIFFSAASIWEIAIKRSLQREAFDFLPENIQDLAVQTGFSELPVKGEHCYAIASLPWYHRDPFDRLLIAQAQLLPAYLLTSDKMLSQYSELVMRVEMK